MLCMPALAAIRFNPDLRSRYRSLKDAGKPSKVAITCVMRKLVVLANASSDKTRSPDTPATVLLSRPILYGIWTC